jgi:transcriptional regulator GlxA family with amidase domain
MPKSGNRNSTSKAGLTVRRDRPAPAPAAGAGRTFHVGFVLVPRFTLVAFAGFIDALRLAADEADRSRQHDCTWSILGEPGRAVRASCGVAVMPTEPYGDPAPFDYVVVVGGLMHGGQLVPREAIAFLRRAAAARKPLVALCTGSFVLARAGLLDGYRSCVSWFHQGEFAREFPAIDMVSDQMFVVDRDRMTCAGGTSVTHLAAHLIERRLGRARANKSLRIMIEDTPLPAETPQPPMSGIEVADPLVKRSILLLEQTLNEPRSVDWLAGRVAVGVRQLERRFRSALGLSPREVALRMRLSHARWLVEHTARPMTSVALECGFTDASHFARCFRRIHGTSPTALRSVRRNYSGRNTGEASTTA